MEKLTINGVDFCNFGSNNYSGGMELITCYPMPENMVQDVLDGKYPGVFLNPSAKCGEEFFGLYGTKEQYESVYAQQRESQIAKRTFDILGSWGASFFGADTFMIRAAKKQATKEYKDWWEK